nr:SNF2-related protein [Streptomyces sp. NBC_00899]
MSLLGHLCGAVPVEQALTLGTGWEPAARSVTATAPARRHDPGFPDALREALALPRVAPALVAELSARIAAGKLLPGDLEAVLFTAASPDWAPARAAALEAVVEGVGIAVSVLTLHQVANHLPAPDFSDERTGSSSPAFRTTANCETGDGPVSAVGPWRRTSRAARAAAAACLLADLAGLPITFANPVSPRATQQARAERAMDLGPQEHLAGLEDAGVVGDLVYRTTASITGLEPLYVCTAACSFSGSVLSATGRGLSPSHARRLAAADLLALVERPRSSPQTEVPKLKGTPLMVLNDAKMKGIISELDTSRVSPGIDGGFTATATCAVGGKKLSAGGSGSSKRQAQRRAAEALLNIFREGPDESTLSGPDTATARPGVRFSPGGAVADREQARAARGALRALFGQGAELTIDLHHHGVRFLVYRPDGSSMKGPCPPPMRSCTADLVLPAIGAAVGLRPVECWQVPVRPLANALTGPDTAKGYAPSVQVWREVIRLGMEVVAAGRVHPALDDTGVDVWRAGPLVDHERARARELRQAMVPPGHCGGVSDRRPYRLWAPRLAVRAGLDAVAEALLRGPGTPVVLGAGPFTAAVPRQQSQPALIQWADAQAERTDVDAGALELTLCVRPPKKGSPHDAELLWATLHVALPDSLAPAERAARPVAADDPSLTARIRRRLRRIAASWAPAARLAERPVPDAFTLRSTEAVLLLGGKRTELERAGLHVRWDQQWTQALRTRAVLRRRPAPANAMRPKFSLDDVLDSRWKISLNGTDLTGPEAAELARAPHPLVNVRSQWVLVDQDTAQRAATPQMPPVAGGEALRAALTGKITVDGHVVDCEPEAELADLVDFLTTGSRTSPVPEPDALTATLRDYQKIGLSWVANTTTAGFGALLADDMGLGKSLTALALHLHRRTLTPAPAGPSMIVCPASMVIAWDREVKTYAPAVPTLTYHGPDRTLEDVTANTVVITTYETLRRDINLLAAHPFDLVIADEAQTIKNHRTATARAIRRLITTARIALTGTPVENDLTDAWALMDWLNPGLFGTHRTFRTQFARPIQDNITDADLTGRLSGLLKAFMLRRTKTDPDVAPELPPKVSSTRIVGLSAEQTDLYQQVADATFREIRAADGTYRKGLLLKLFTQLQQICNSPSHYLAEPLDGPDGYDPHLAAQRSGKLAALDDLLPILTRGDESALIFTRYRAMARILDTHLRGHGHSPLYFSGDITSGADRQRVIDNFQSGPGRLMVMTVKAGGSGLTLTQANHVVLFDRPWNPSKEAQAIDRAHRIGQQRTVNVHRIITENTLEDRVDELLRHKRALADAVLADGYSALTELTDDQIADLIALGAQ